ncbi:glycosyl hydrolase family 2 protein [Caldanaerobius polysaccharolyticus]|uniref:hypothetical protein n=1 Tax=Caldanaerobius polysaccharolyticus TaxID=44256 RepID=UPI00047D6955|nr:hypothetical protein [Caldanaerobius polysaccharolyticus]
MDLKEFKDPGAMYRNAPFWSWNDRLDRDELRRQIREMADKGWGGYFMHSRVGLVTGYLSREWMDMVKTCAEEAKATGTYAWLYDEDKWPSGFAGGEVPEADEKYRSRALVLVKPEEVTENDTPVVQVKWDGEEYVICKRVSPLGDVWFNGACYVDLMNPETVKAFINSTHERYKEAVGMYFGKEIPGIFTDEPCYLRERDYLCPAVPWSDCLPEYFKRLKGYSIEDHLKELFFDVGDYKKVRFDFYDAATRLFVDSWTKQYYRWCEQNNLKMTGHFMAEDSLISQTQWIGAAMPHYQFMHWPGIDKLGRHVQQLVTVKQVTSAVDQLDKERAFCEVFGCVGQQVSFYHRKWIADWQAVLGISFVNSHLSLYSMRGERKRDYPANLFYQQPWWDCERPFADYIGRVNYAVSQGKRDVDILVVHPIASVWSEYSPLHKKHGFPVENNVYDKPFEMLSKKLMALKLDFHYGDEIIMENSAKVERGKLIIGKHEYSTVLVPPSLTLRSTTLALLKEFVKQAGPDRLIFIKPVPERIDGISGDMNLPREVICVDSVDEALEIVDRYYSERIRITDKRTEANADKVYCHSRTASEGKLVFIVNTDEEREVDALISLPGEEMPYLLDLMSGDVYSIPSKVKSGRREVDVKLYPAGSMLLFYPLSEMKAPTVPPFLDSGVAFKFDKAQQSTIDRWDVEVLEQNVLPLNDVTLYLNGEKVLQDQPVAKAWHRYFYAAPDGTPFRAEYKFEVLNVPCGDVFAAIEMAENLDKITINGVEVKPLKKPGEMGSLDPQKSWKDVNFTKVPLKGYIHRGLNVLALEGKKDNNISGPGCHVRVKDFEHHMPTEVETVYVVGNFAVVDFDRRSFAIDSEVGEPDSRDLTASGYPFYAGKVQFSSSFEYREKGQRVYLELSDVNAACVKLYVNGQYAGIKYWRPYAFDVTEFLREGRNEIKVVAATTLFNLMGPHRIAGILEEEWVSPRTFVDFSRFTETYSLLPFGIGKARAFLIS